MSDLIRILDYAIESAERQEPRDPKIFRLAITWRHLRNQLEGGAILDITPLPRALRAAKVREQDLPRELRKRTTQQ